MILFLIIFAVLGMLGFGFWARIFGGVIISSILSDTETSEEGDEWDSSDHDQDRYNDGWTDDD